MTTSFGLSVPNIFAVSINVCADGTWFILFENALKILKSKKIDVNKAKKNAPIAAIYSSPAIWQKKRLISAPIFDYSYNRGVNIEIKKIGYMI